MWPLLSVPLVLALLLRPHVHLPRYAGLWALFVGWVVVSAVSLEGTSTVLGFGYRAAGYLSASVVLLYVLNTSRAVLPAASVVNALAAYFVVLVAGGWVAVGFPDLGWTSPVEAFLPPSLANIPFVADLVHPQLAQPSDFLGYELGRPHPFFAYTNEWGSTLVLLAPVAVLAREQASSALGRVVLLVALVGAAVPLVLSLNRGAWASLLVAAVYVVARVLASGHVRHVGRIAVLVVALAGALWTTGVAGVVSDRLAHPHSDEGRATLYEETVDRALERPVLGHGAPRPSSVNPGLPSVGTHGQWFLVLFSQGLPGLLLLAAWLVLTFVAFHRDRHPLSLCTATCLLIVAVQGFYYELLPMQLPLLAALVGLAWRERDAREPVVRAARSMRLPSRREVAA
jgi:hypothetical protein